MVSQLVSSADPSAMPHVANCRFACPYLAVEPASDHECDPTNQDSGASFPDKSPSQPSPLADMTLSSQLRAIYPLAGSRWLRNESQDDGRATFMADLSSPSATALTARSPLS